MKYFSSSEAVSSGHPDRLCDNIAAIIINDVQKKDGIKSHAAIEVFATHDSIIIGGEATTTLALSEEYLRGVVVKAFDRSGYIPEMRKFWNNTEVVLPEDLVVVNKIAAQSPDIALGTTDKGEDSGWNDQGVYFSSADKSNYSMQGYPMTIAITLCEALQKYSRQSILQDLPVVLGPDNKAVITVRVAEDGMTPEEVTAVTIAASHASKNTIEEVRDHVEFFAKKLFQDMGVKVAQDCKWVINGTGRFVVHGPISDTSMTGRKISVNHPSAGPVWCNKMIGGGSLVKPAHASDLMLNLASRLIANIVVAYGLSSYAVVGCSGSIGVKGLQSIFIKGDDKFESNEELKVNIYEFFHTQWDWSPNGIAKMLAFFDDYFDFGVVVDRNFFGHPQCQPWEGQLVEIWSLKLDEYLRKKQPSLF